MHRTKFGCISTGPHINHPPYLHTGDLEAAAELLFQLLTLDIERDGDAHPAVATGCLDLGCCFQALGRWEAATLTLEWALPRLARCYGPDHPRVRDARNRLAAISGQLSGQVSATA